MRRTINAVIIRDNSILLVRKGQSWLLPGGKPKLRESDLECLSREIGEELSNTQLQNIRYYRSFVGLTHENERFMTNIYFADIKGDLNPPSLEISECRWVEDVNQYQFSEINSKVINSLIKDGYLK